MLLMKKWIVFFILFVPVLSFGQGSILWEISGNGLSAPSYLMGTLKFIGEKEFYLPLEATSRMKKVKLFAIEDQVDHHAQHELNKALHFPKGESLKTALSAEQYNQVVVLFQKEFGVDTKTFEKKYSHIIPLALSIAMTRLSLKENVKFYDIELLAYAKKNNLETYSLEEIDREAEAINKFTMADQVKALMHSVNNFDEQKSEYKKLMADYPEGDLEEIFKYTLHPTENNLLFLEEFYYKRNAEWLPKMEKMMKDQPSFIAVGISHLESDSGLLNLIKEKGYTLTPVPVK
jgi:uncharacterized protein YbaP (TraB family)